MPVHEAVFHLAENKPFVDGKDCSPFFQESHYRLWYPRNYISFWYQSTCVVLVNNIYEASLTRSCLNRV
jgi:hypothetical protein